MSDSAARMSRRQQLQSWWRSLLYPTAFAGRIPAVCAASFAVLLLIGWLDNITGYEFGFFIFYFIPVSISAWYGGKRPGLFIACSSAVCWLLSDMYTHHPYSRAYFIYWEMFMRLASFLTTALTLARIRELILNEERMIRHLRSVQEENERLRRQLGTPR